MRVLEVLTGQNSKGGLITIASTASVHTFLAKWLALIAFNLSDSVAELAGIGTTEMAYIR